MYYLRALFVCANVCELAGTRTQDPYIKSVLLYQLSYQFSLLLFKSIPFYLRSAKIGQKHLEANFFRKVFILLLNKPKIDYKQPLNSLIFA